MSDRSHSLSTPPGFLPKKVKTTKQAFYSKQNITSGIESTTSAQTRVGTRSLVFLQTILCDYDGFVFLTDQSLFIHQSCNESSRAIGGAGERSSSPTLRAHGLLGLLVSPLVVPLDVVVAPQQSVPRLEFAPNDGQEVTWQVAPPVVDLPHDDVPAPCQEACQTN